jgi:hypothetical protein
LHGFASPLCESQGDSRRPCLPNETETQAPHGCLFRARHDSSIVADCPSAASLHPVTLRPIVDDRGIGGPQGTLLVGHAGVAGAPCFTSPNAPRILSVARERPNDFVHRRQAPYPLRTFHDGPPVRTEVGGDKLCLLVVYLSARIPSRPRWRPDQTRPLPVHLSGPEIAVIVPMGDSPDRLDRAGNGDQRRHPAIRADASKLSFNGFHNLLNYS